MKKPFVVGLTGGIASGKTAASDNFAKLGVDIVDADIIAREVVAPKQPALQAIIEHFGSNIVNSTGQLDRTALRAKVFNNASEQSWLNELLHPAIRLSMQAKIQASRTPYVVLVVPLLVENGLTALCDRVLVIDVPEDMQISRAIERDKCEATLIKNIMKAQADRQQRLELADDVIVNDKDRAHLSAQVSVLHKNYLTLASK
jgi:dephospho-CoA kinase